MLSGLERDCKPDPGAALRSVIPQSEQGHGTTSADPSHHDPDDRADSSTHSIGSESDEFDGSAFSRLIDKAPDMGSSQVFDQSSVLAEVTLSTGDDGGFGVCVCSN